MNIHIYIYIYDTCVNILSICSDIGCSIFADILSDILNLASTLWHSEFGIYFHILFGTLSGWCSDMHSWYMLGSKKAQPLEQGPRRFHAMELVPMLPHRDPHLARTKLWFLLQQIPYGSPFFTGPEPMLTNVLLISPVWKKTSVCTTEVE